MRLIPRGELIEYTEMMGRARKVAADQMIAQAEELGADAIINIRFMATSVIGSAAEFWPTAQPSNLVTRSTDG